MVRIIFEDADSMLELSNEMQDERNIGVGLAIQGFEREAERHLFILPDEDFDKFIEEITKIHNIRMEANKK